MRSQWKEQQGCFTEILWLLFIIFSFLMTMGIFCGIGPLAGWYVS